jgi:flagellar FliJ protein
MNATTLRLLIERAKAASELALARHGQLRRAEEQARVHLGMLQQYAGEYAERARSRTGDSRDPSADRNQVVFLARLQVAIDTQAAEVTARAAAAATAAQEVAACRQRQKSLETLDARRRQDEARTAARREQKDTDEFAQRAGDRWGAGTHGYDDGHAGRDR